MAIHVKQHEMVAAKRQMYFHCVDVTDGMTPENGEEGGIPQLSLNGAAWENATNTLILIGDGRYYLEMDTSEVATIGVIEGRYKSANTAEIPGTTIQVVQWDPYDLISSIFSKTGLTAGGTWNFGKMLKILLAWTAGNWKPKSGATQTWQILDAEDKSTVIAEAMIDPSSSIMQVTIL